ncbi:MAG: hypothetical protein HOF21_09885 [Nitrospina sp.]|jgi:hypothetical protein|nr:hypothetical protein [Nitrospina sp.]MBT5633313.1 hypothetical protein [Nitrospina sp.]
MNQSDIKLIYFDGCPNYEVAKNLLLQSGCKFEEINQSNLPDDHAFKQYTSPTILKNGRLIVGEKMASKNGGCSLQLPSYAEFRKSLGMQAH